MSENNPEKELIAQLSSDKRSVVIQAIVKLSRAGKSTDCLKTLLPFINSSDREISFFAFQAASKIASKAKVDLNEFLTESSINTGDNLILTRQELLSANKDTAAKTLKKIREKADNISRELLPAAAVFLGRFGDIQDVDFLEKNLKKEDSTLVIPFIDALEKISPQVLTRALPNLLASKHPMVRSRAISALQRIDPEEAERHFSDLLASRNPEDRLAGIGIAFLFPFQRVKGYILSSLAEEQDLDVLKACQTFLASNPELDCALGILDCIDSVSNEQRSRLTIIFKTVCQAISATKVLKPEDSTPEAIVKLWKAQRLEAFLNDLEIQLSLSNETKKATLIAWIENNRNHPKVQELIERLGRNPQTEAIFMQLTQAKAKLNSEQSANPKAEEPESRATANNDLVLKMRKMELEHFKENKSWLMSTAENGEPELRQEALLTLLRLHPDGKLIELAKKGLESNDSRVKIAAFKVLEKIDKTYLSDKISELLQEDDPNIRVRAVRFALKSKESEAIVTLKNLLKSNEQRIRANAVACLGLCPFNSVFRILMDQLDSEEHPAIAKHITSILLNNPSRRVLKALDNITRTSSPAVAMVISQARNDLFEIVSQMPEDKAKEFEDPVDQNSAKPYSLENVRNIARSRQKDWKPGYKASASTIREKLAAEGANWSLIISGAVVIIVLALLPVMMLSGSGHTNMQPTPKPKDWRDNERKRFSHTQIPKKFRMNRPCSVSAVVEKVISDTSMVIKHENSQIMVKFDSPKLANVTAGTELVLTMVPYRVNPRGIILAKGTNLAISKGQEQ
ncbi:MAG: hypothetical protein Kow0029_16660 [Candidatus Rifleibacteriota bacterium]